MPLFLREDMRLFLYQVGERLLQKHEKKRYTEHDDKNGGCRKLPAGNEQSENSDDRSIKYKACHSVAVKPDFSVFLL